MRPAENAERDKTIYSMVRQGATKTDIARITGLTRQRIHQIITEQEPTTKRYEIEVHYVFHASETLTITAEDADTARDAADQLASGASWFTVNPDRGTKPYSYEIGSIYEV